MNHKATSRSAKQPPEWFQGSFWDKDAKFKPIKRETSTNCADNLELHADSLVRSPESKMQFTDEARFTSPLRRKNHPMGYQALETPHGKSVGSYDEAQTDSNKLHFKDRAAHDWYRFVLSFPPHLVRDYLLRFGISQNHRILDPFCGTGTTIVECKKHGIPSIGIEANPIAHFASEVKLNWSPDPDGLLRHARKIADDANQELESTGIYDFSFPLMASKFPQEHTLQKLPEEKQRLLLENSISPLPLHKTLVLLEHIKRNFKKEYHNHELLALANALVSSISNLHFGPEVGVGKIKSDVPVISAWLTRINAIADDLHSLKADKEVSAEIHLADSRTVSDVIDASSIDAVITSPPYPNEKDYTRTTRLESVVLGFIHEKSQLQALKKGLVRSNTRSVYKSDDDDAWISDNSAIQLLAETIEARRIALNKTSGFERLYARLTKLYFGGMARHLSGLRQVLRPGAFLAYVVGDQASYLRVMIRTGQLLSQIAQSLGYELISVDLFRTRLSTATREQLREEVVVLRWPGTSRKTYFMNSHA